MSTVLTVVAALLAVTGVTLIVIAARAQVHPPTPPPVSAPAPNQVVPLGVQGPPVLRIGLPTVTGRTAPQLVYGGLLPGPDLLPHAPTPADLARAAPTPEQLRQARALAAVPASPPATIRVPSIGVDSVVDPVGLTPTGEMEVPAPGPAYDHAAWYRYSVTPGRQGPSVIIGHIDSRENGPSVFFDLGRLHSGDTIDVTRADGVTVAFGVSDVRTVSKDAFPTADVYGATRSSELRLISCGGSFDYSDRNYRDNIVVFARELSSSVPAAELPPPSPVSARVPGHLPG